MIHDVEELCLAVGCTIDNETLAQKRIEDVLTYLQDFGVIEVFKEDRLDWIFSNEQMY